MTQASHIIKRLLVAIFLSLILIFFIHDRVHAETLRKLSSFEHEQTVIDEVTCESFTETLIQVRDRLTHSAQSLEDYLQNTNQNYIDWHQHLTTFEGRPSRWNEGDFDTLGESAQTLEEAKNSIYEIISSDEEVLYQVAGVLEDTECFSQVDPDLHSAWVEEFYKLIQYNSEHISTAGEFISRMAKRLSAAAVEWQKLEQADEQALPVGYFSRLKADAEIFSEASHLVGSNGRFVAQQFELFRARVVDQRMPLAPGLRPR